MNRDIVTKNYTAMVVGTAIISYQFVHKKSDSVKNKYCCKNINRTISVFSLY